MLCLSLPMYVFSPICEINRRSYRSAHVLLNLLNSLPKRDKTLWLSIQSLFRNEFNKFNNTGAQIVEEPGFKNVKNKHLGMPPF